MKNIHNIYIAFFLTLFFSYTSLASQRLEIKVIDRQAQGLPGATVKLTAADTDKNIYQITDLDGIAHFDVESLELYHVQVSYIGFETFQTDLRPNPDRRRIDVQLAETTIALGEVTVTARRPLVRQEGDRTIYDPEPLVSLSTNTMELLETVPGVFVDPDGGVYLGSATPAAIYINGREQRMGTQNIATLLRSLPPSSIDRIEVMRTPSARFDAASSGGIINIVLKRGYRIGRFGTMNAGMNQGIMGNRFGSINYNSGGDNATYYMNVSYNHHAQEQSIESFRHLVHDRSLQQSAITRSNNNQGYVGYGVNYDFRDNLLFNYDGRINMSLPRSVANNYHTIESLESVLLSEDTNLTENSSRSLNVQQDLGLRYLIDTIGSSLDTRFSYSHSNSNNSQDYTTQFMYPGNLLWGGFGDNSQIRHFLNLQSDLTLQYNSGIILETGLKSAYQQFKSEADYFTDFNGNISPDGIRTSAFNYNEFINSTYVQASTPLPGDLILKAGLRLEQSYMNGFQTIPSDTSFLVNRVDLFPYLFLSRRLFEIADHEFHAYMIYRRSINRPSFQNLNPHNRFLDQYMFETGNPALKPQFTENYEANISLDDFPVFAIGRSYIRDIFTNVTYQDPNDSNVSMRTYDNVGMNRETYFRIVGAIPPGGTYFFVAGTQYNLNQYEGVYEDEPLSFSRGSWRFYTFHSLNFGRNTRLTVTGLMILNGHQNFYALNTMGQVNIGLNHSFFDRKLTVSLSARDVLRTMETQFMLNQGSQFSSGTRYNDTQRFGINIRYHFGIRNKPERTNMFDFDNGE